MQNEDPTPETVEIPKQATNRAAFLDYLFSLAPHQRTHVLKQFPGLKTTKAFLERAEKEKLARNADLHRRSCLSGYAAKKKRVEAENSTHKFIHPFTT